MGSPPRTSPASTTIAMRAVLRMRFPDASRSQLAAMRPGWRPASWLQELRSPVNSPHHDPAQGQPGSRRELEEIAATGGDVLIYRPGTPWER